MNSGSSSSSRQEYDLTRLFTGLCAGLDPVLEAVVQLPDGGLPIPSSAESLARNFFLQQLDAASDASNSSTQVPGSSSRSVAVPKDVQTLQQLGKLLLYASTLWSNPDFKNAKPLALAAGQLVADAARVVARQQVAERNTQAYNTLLAEGYRAGLIALSCAALKGALGLHINTHQQLARLIVVVHKMFRIAAVDPRTGCRSIDDEELESFLRTNLKSFHGGSSSRTAWRLDVPQAYCALRMLLTPVVESLDPSVLPQEFQAYTTQSLLRQRAERAQVASTAAPSTSSSSSSNSQQHGTTASSAAHNSSSGGSSSNSKTSTSSTSASTSSSKQPVKNSGSAADTIAVGSSSSSQQSSASAGTGGDTGSNSTTTTTSSSSSKKQPSVAAGVAAHASSSSSQNASKTRPAGWDLQFDECALLVQHCSNLGPVLKAVADWAATRSPKDADVCVLVAALTKHFANEVAAARRSKQSGSSSKVVSDGPRRRTLLPPIAPYGVLSLDGLNRQVDGRIDTFFQSESISKLTADLQAAAVQLVCGAAMQVVCDLRLKEGSAVLETLLQTAMFSGCLLVGCASLSQHLGIRLQTGQQLAAALKLINSKCYNAQAAAAASGMSLSPKQKREVASDLCHRLAVITSSSSSTPGGNSSSSSGSSSSTECTYHQPKCGLDAAYDMFMGILQALTVVKVWEGPLSKAAAEQALQADLQPLQQHMEQMFQGGDGASTKPLLSFLSMMSNREEHQPQEIHDSFKGLAQFLQLLGATPPAAAEPAVRRGQQATSAAASQPKPAVGSSSVGATAAGLPAGKAAAGAAGAAGAAAGAGAAAAGAQRWPKEHQQAVRAQFADDPHTRVVREKYCSARAFELGDDEPINYIELELLAQWGFFTASKDDGFHALHYACAGHRVELVEKLLDAGAPVNVPSGLCQLQPLHLACMPRIRNLKQFQGLQEACGSTAVLAGYMTVAGPGCLPLVKLLLKHGADPNAVAGAELAGLTPLHITSCWIGCDEVFSTVFTNPYMGMAWFMEPDDPGLRDSSSRAGYAIGMQNAAAADTSSAQYFLCLGSEGEDLDKEICSMLESEHIRCLKWNDKLEAGVQQLEIVMALDDAGADIDAVTLPDCNSPLMIAAAAGNAALADLLCRLGADTEQRRSDGARALDVAAAQGHCRLGWALLCHGALAVPEWMMRGEPRLPHSVHVPLSSLAPEVAPFAAEMLVCNAVQCTDTPWNFLFLQRLLADGAPLDEVWPKSGETPLLMAINYRDVEMVRLLVHAGADLNADSFSTRVAPAIQHALECSRSEPQDAEILQILIDAGADLGPWSSDPTEYDFVQVAANNKDTDAALKLVEAGAKWQLPKDQHTMGGTIYYPPEILAVNLPNLKIGYVEGRFKRAEKIGRNKRAAAAAALEPWLSPEVLPEIKEATVRTLVAAGVTPSRPQLHRQQAAARPVKSARWNGDLEQQLQQGMQGGPWASGNGQQKQQKVASKAASKQVNLQQQQQDRAQTPQEDIDALLAALGVDAASTAAPASSKAAAGKKKKKETAAQKEAKKQQKLRLQRLQEQQQQQQQGDSSSDLETQSSGQAGDGVQPAPAADAASESRTGDGTATTPKTGAGGLSVAKELQGVETSQHPTPPWRPEQPQPAPKQQSNAPAKQKKGKQGKAGAQQQQQQQPGLDTSAAAGESQAVKHGPAKQPAAGPAPASQAPAAAAAAASSAPGPGIAATSAAGTAAAPVGTNPQPRLAPMAFLPPHLRMSMPAAAGMATPGNVQQAAQVDPAAAQPPSMLRQPLQQLVMQQQQQLPDQQHQMQQVIAQQRMMLAQAAGQQHKQQQQDLLLTATDQVPPPPPQQQQQQEVPGLPMAMMAALAGTAKPGHPKPAVSQAPAGDAECSRNATAAGAPAGPKAPTAAAQPAGRAAGSSSPSAGGGVKGSKLCVSCGQGRRNVLFMPCKHMLLCDACADVDSCPSCGKPCTQRIRVHQS